nr:hypothetical protein [Mucilaginibacter sp. L294]
MTLSEKVSHFINHLNLWIDDFNRGRLDTNNARKTIESICKASILKNKGDVIGTQIILGKNAQWPNRKIGSGIGELNLENLIHIIYIDELGVLKDGAVYNQLETIRKLGNDGSHDPSKSYQVVDMDDINSCHYALIPIVRWFYKEVLKIEIPEAVMNILNGNVNSSIIPDKNEKWNELLMLCKNFDKRFQYILVSPQNVSENISVVDAINKLPWRLVVDFDNKSDEKPNGLLLSFQKLIGTGYKKSFTIEDRPDFDPKFNHYWFLANGQGAVQPVDDFKKWRFKYKKYLSDSLYTNFNKGSRPKSRIVVFLNIKSYWADSIIDEFNRVDETNLSFVLCSNTDETYDDILSKYDNVSYIDISATDIADGVNNSISFSDIGLSNLDILIPHKNDQKNKVYVSVTQQDYDYLQTLGIEIIYKNIERESVNEVKEDNFYKGGLITWNDLKSQKDVSRNALDNLQKRLNAELEKNKRTEIELIHEAGAGGTTIARRLAYNISLNFPTIILRKYEAKKTIAGLRIIYDKYIKSSLPLLIILESFEVRESNVLYKDLAQAHKNAVILIVKRGKITAARDKKFTLKGQLEINEITSFENLFFRLSPVRKEHILNIKNEFKYSPDYISPFVYGLVTYGKEFLGIDDYVGKCLQDISLEQKKIAGTICLIYHFTQLSVPGELFSGLLGINRSECNLREILGEGNPIFELLHEDYDDDGDLNIWRPRHAILGGEAMKILLGGGKEYKQNWNTYLSQWLIELIKYAHMAMPYLDDFTKQILDALFIDRIENDVIEINKGQFTDVFSKLKSPSEGVEIFETLTDAYPDEAHYHGHFARYLYDDRTGVKDFNRAIHEAELSLQIQPRDVRLMHTLGMCYRVQAENIISKFDILSNYNEDIEEEVKYLVEQSCEAFDRCIELEPNKVYGHESQIRILLSVLDFGYKLNKSSSKETFITNPQNEWYAKKLDKTSNLLEEALYVIEQSQGLDNKDRINKSAGYIYECEGNFLKTLGKTSLAKDKFENLIKNTPSGYQYMVPRYRRMYINCLLATKNTGSRDYFNAWGEISENELNQCIRYLSDNMFEDSANTQNVKLWLQAVRFLKNPIRIEECISKIGTWTQTIGQNINSSLESNYYLYVLNAIKAISNGNTFDSTSVQNVKELKDRMKGFIKNEKFCFEWYGIGTGMQQMVSHKKLGEFTTDFFEKNKKILSEVTGRIKNVISSQNGIIVLDCGLEAFFVPNIGSYTEKNKNDRVKFFVGFRFDQIQAWSVIPIEKNRDDTSLQSEQIEILNTIQKDEVIENITIIEDNSDVVKINKLPGLKFIGKINLD